MTNWLERYQGGSCLEVYNELLVMQDRIREPSVYQEALLVAQEMMSRIQHNLNLLLPRLRTLGYELVDGDWSSYWDHTEPSDTQFNEQLRAYREPPLHTPMLLNEIEQRVGALPLTVRCWYEQVGSVNLIGAFPQTQAHPKISYELDPLLIIPVDCLLDQYGCSTEQEWVDARNADGTFELELGVDADLKYNFSGSGGYFIRTPCYTFDTTLDLLGYQHGSVPTFINYLRTCLRWGGFYGLSTQNQPGLTKEELAFLTRDFLEF